MLEALRTAWRLPDIRNKLLITGFLLLVYQFAAHIPVIGVQREALQTLLDPSTAGADFVQVLNLLSGGAVRNFSVLANGVYPYITASIIFNLLTPVIPRLQAIQKEPGGNERIQRYTYYATIPMAILQSLGQITVFNSLLTTSTGIQTQIIDGFGTDLLTTVAVLATMTAGTMFAIWLGELITEQGIGNGISIIIFAGIVSQVPLSLVQLLGSASPPPAYNLIMFVVIVLVSTIVIILIQEGVRRIPVQYGKRVRGRKQYGGASTHIPLRVNPVGMIPLIFSQSMITFPAIIASFLPEGPFKQSITTTFGNQQGAVYWLAFFALTFAFTFFYAFVMIGNQDIAGNLQRQGGFIPGIRPGKRTEEYITRVTQRITFVGALFLGIVAVTPGIVDWINSLIVPGYLPGTTNNAAQVISGSGLIIVVGVVIDTLRQLEAQLVMRNYEGFMR